MAPLVPVVVPLTLNARNTFLRDEAKHPANDSCPTNSLISSKPNASAKQFVVPQQPVQEKMNITSSENNEDHTRDGDSNSALLLMTDDRDLNGRRKVQWNDSHGKELASVWKFQPSDSSDSDDEEDDHSLVCTCAIM